MKYLIFNVSVFLALGYLLVGAPVEKVQAKIDPFFEKAAHQAEKVVAPKQQVSKPKPAPATKVVEKVTPPPAPIKVEKPKPEKNEDVAATPPALPKPIEVAKAKVNAAPAPTLNPVEQAVSPMAPEVSSEASQDPVETARQRSKDLRKLVADMEQMFAQKLTR